MKITITLQDDENGQVQVEEVRQLCPGEKEASITPASALAEAMFSLLEELGETETVVEAS